MKRIITSVLFLLACVTAVEATPVNPNATGMKYQVATTSEPSEGGTVSGGGVYFEFNTCTLTALPNEGYRFVHWTSNGTIVSNSPTYQFTVVEDIAFVAHFAVCTFEEAELGYSIYDWQSNSGARTWTHVWPDGKVNFAYTVSNDLGNATRGTAIDTYDAATGTWQLSGGRVENEKTGFGSIAQYGSNGIVVAAHTSSNCCIYIVPDKDNITAQSVSAASVLNSPYRPSWPAVMTSGPNRDIIHVVAHATQGSVPDMEGVHYPVLYFRSSDGGQTWDRENVVLPYMDPSYALSWTGNNCYWMETTDDNCLALVVNNPWSDGMVIYSYDNGNTWQRKVFYHHPDLFGDFSEPFYYPLWTSCQWDSQHRLHVLYEFNAATGNPGASQWWDPCIGGVAYWNEEMPYHSEGTTQSGLADNLVPGQPFVMEHAYLQDDIYSSLWMLPDASHEMWPEYIGYLPPLTEVGDPEDPYDVTDFNIHVENLSNHGTYVHGICAFPVLCMVPETDEMVAVWSAMDENHVDENEYNYYKIFASYSGNGGASWSPMVQLTKAPSFNQMEFVYNQAAIVGRKLVVVAQTDATAGCYNDYIYDQEPSDNHYQGLVFDIDQLFDTEAVQDHVVTVDASPAAMGEVTGGGVYHAGTACDLLATPTDGCHFVNWTRNDTVISNQPSLRFIVTDDVHIVAHFSNQPIMHEVAAIASPVQGGSILGTGSYAQGSLCTLLANANSGYRFVRWTRNGIQVSADASLEFTVMQDVELVAHYEVLPVYYNITAQADPAEGGSILGEGVYLAGEQCTLIAVAATGYSFVNWTLNGTEVSTSTYYAFIVTNDCHLVAHFVLVDAVGEDDESALSMYPNPVKKGGEVVVVLPANSESAIVEVVDVMGRVVATKQGDERLFVPTAGLLPGVYTVLVRQADACLVHKLVVQE